MQSAECRIVIAGLLKNGGAIRDPKERIPTSLALLGMTVCFIIARLF